MKLKNLILTVFVLVGFAACNNEDIPNGGGDGQKYDTYLTVNVSTPVITTPADRTKTTGPAATDTDGSTIASIHVYLVKNGVIEFSHSPSITGLTTEKFEVPTGEYKLFVVANPNSKTPLRNTGTINMVVEDVTKSQAEGGYDGGTNFMMATACDVVDITTAGENVSILATNTESNPATATAKVDRAAVKINNKTIGDVSSILTGEIENIEDEAGNAFFTKVEVKGYVLINGNTKFNLIQKWEALTGNIVGTVANTPQGTIVDNTMTGYYSPITEFGKISMTQDVNTGKWTTTAIEDLTNGDPAIYGKNPVFTTENRPAFIENAKLTSGMAQTTGVIYHTVVNDGQTFYYVGGIVYSSLDELKKLDAFKDKNWDNSTTASEIRLAGVKVYENGNMYYNYFIEDQNYSVEYKGTVDTKYYNVLRNSVYNLTINSIQNIGDDIPGGGGITPENPNPPIDSDNTYLEVTVTVNPWVLNEIGVDL